MKKVAAVVALVLVLSIMLTGCSSVKGKWTLDRAEAMGMTLNGDALKSAFGSEVTLEFKSGGVVVGNLEGGSDSSKGTYKVKGKEVDITFEDETVTAQIDGKELVIKEPSSGATMYFVKKK